MDPTAQISQEQLHFLMNAAQGSLLNFAQVVDNRYEVERFHEIIADKLEECLEAAIQKKKKRVILSIPPRHGKSELASIKFPAWGLGKHPDLRFILSTYGSELSETNGMKTRDLISSEGYHSVFPKVRLKSDMKSKANWMVENPDPKGNSYIGGYYAVGIGGAVTGKGADILLIDDPHKDRAEAESETMRKLVWDYYRSTLRSRLEGHGVVILIMQRWRQDDLVGLLLEEDERRVEAGEEPEGWEVISLPAIAEDDEYYKGELTRKQGEPLWEAKFPIAVLESIRQTSPYFWSSQYQQNPILAETAEFKNEMFQYYVPDDLKYKNLRYYTLVDPAISQKTSADNTVVLTVAKEVDGHNFYRIREDAGRFTPQQTVDLIFVHQKEYRSDVWIETIAYQEALKYLVQTRQKKDQVYFVVHDIKSRTNKETRIRGLLGLYQNRVIWHLKGADTSYELELMAFPRGRRDDRADVMSQILLAQESMQGGSFAKQFKKKWNGYGRSG